MRVGHEVLQGLAGEAGPFLLIGWDGQVFGACRVAGGSAEECADLVCDQVAEVEKLLARGLRVVGVACALPAVPRFEAALSGAAGGSFTYLTLPSLHVWNPVTGAKALAHACDTSGAVVAVGEVPALTQLVSIDQGDPADAIERGLRLLTDRLRAADVSLQGGTSAAKGGRVEARIAVPNQTETSDRRWARYEANPTASVVAGVEGEDSQDGVVHATLVFQPVPAVGVGATPELAAAALREDLCRVYYDVVDEWRAQQPAAGAGPLPPTVTHSLPSRGIVALAPAPPLLAAVPCFVGYGTERNIQSVFSEMLGARAKSFEGNRAQKKASRHHSWVFAGLIALPAFLAALILSMVA
ncbi:hypothetical protein DIPPA_24666 [Diplonema papillatum]|nr:hypothetical protein DIPPA_24666 [Diplonema papillatum]